MHARYFMIFPKQPRFHFHCGDSAGACIFALYAKKVPSFLSTREIRVSCRRSSHLALSALKRPGLDCLTRREQPTTCVERTRTSRCGCSFDGNQPCALACSGSEPTTCRATWRRSVARRATFLCNRCMHCWSESVHAWPACMARSRIDRSLGFNMSTLLQEACCQKNALATFMTLYSTCASEKRVLDRNLSHLHTATVLEVQPPPDRTRHYNLRDRPENPSNDWRGAPRSLSAPFQEAPGCETLDRRSVCLNGRPGTWESTKRRVDGRIGHTPLAWQ